MWLKLEARSIYGRVVHTTEIAAVIAHAKAFIGTSLHGAITAFAYGVPFLTYSCAHLSKLEGFLDLVDSKERLCLTMGEILDRASLLNEIPSRESYRKATLAIDKHFDHIGANINSISPYVGDKKHREMLARYLEILHKNDGLIQIVQLSEAEKKVKAGGINHLMKVVENSSIKKKLRSGFLFHKKEKDRRELCAPLLLMETIE